jgi:undecaprenyl-diphosphatase
MARGFWARRLARGSPTGLVLTLGVLLAGMALGVFVLIAAAVEAQGALVELDQDWARRLHEEAWNSAKTRMLFLVVTQAGSGLALAILTASMVVLLFRRRHYVLAVCCGAGVVGGGLIDYYLKSIFQRHRPQFDDPIVLHTTFSFPSGHSLSSLVAYGFLAYLLMRWRTSRWQRLLIGVLLAAWILAIGISRMYLGAHYLSDVLGGFTAGVCWLVIVITALEVIRRRRQAMAVAVSHPPDDPAGTSG